MFYLLRPVLPYIDYAINKDYISKNLCINKDIPGNCCHGKCYLDEQIKKNSIPVDYDRDNNKKIFQEKRIEDHLKTEVMLLRPVETDFILVYCYNIMISDCFLIPAFVPPKC
jgi:hypothetical protein